MGRAHSGGGGPAPLEYQTDVFTYRPASHITAHEGQLMDGRCRFFHPPPPEIGEVRSADSTLRSSRRALRPGFRIALIAVAAALALVPAAAIELRDRGREPHWFAWTFFAVLGAGAAAATAWGTRFHHVCTYVGTLGVARITLRGSAFANPQVELFLFNQAAELRVTEVVTRVSALQVSTHYYTYEWTDAMLRPVFQLQGSDSGSMDPRVKVDGRPFAKAAEYAWSLWSAPAAWAQFERTGSVRFNSIGPGEFAVVSADTTVIASQGVVSEVKTRDIGTVGLQGGRIVLRPRFGVGAPLSLSYSDLGNAQLFMWVVAQLSGASLT